MAEYASEMRLFDPETQERLYLDAKERERFLEAADKLENRSHCLLCEVIHWTGCRISEALELTPRRIDINNRVIRYRTIKKRKYTRQGELKAAVFRDVPISKELARHLDMFFHIRKARKTRKGLDSLLWPNQADPKRPVARTTGWRIIKRVLDAAGIEGPQATAKGLRHGYAVAMILGDLDVHILQKRLGHESVETTAIYLQVVGEEAHALEERAWKKANESWGQ
ncbi:MAG: site-specific integrase [Candidatus Thiodiazotropha sp.]